MALKALFSATAIALTILAFLPYVLSILRGATRPHVFSWVIWGITTIIVFFAQLDAEGGVGAWPTGVSGSLTIFIAGLAYWKRADITITRLDWLFFAAALLSLPVWYFTSDPLWTVVILTTVDLLGFGPTVRKTYAEPWSESQVFYGMFVARNFFSILALERYSLTTLLFPAAMFASCVAFMAMVAHRRRVLVA